MTHLDLFSGIGGFAYAADQVWDDVEHIFCDNDKFCQQVLNKHWPEAKIYDDIRTITADTEGKQNRGLFKSDSQRHSGATLKQKIDILTGGFPCQPFSAAGLRRGTADDRHLWPEMLRVIRLTKPTWVIAENVRGLLTWNEGLVFEQVCLDLEAQGYEVQPFIIPAVAVNAPHRRDRIWFVAHAIDDRYRRRPGQAGKADGLPQVNRPEVRSGRAGRTSKDATDSQSDGTQRRLQQQNPDAKPIQNNDWNWDWNWDWTEVAAELCGVDARLSAGVDRPEFTLTAPGHRKERLKSLGNAIVPQIAMEIMRGIAAPPKLMKDGE